MLGCLLVEIFDLFHSPLPEVQWLFNPIWLSMRQVNLVDIQLIGNLCKLVKDGHIDIDLD